MKRQIIIISLLGLIFPALVFANNTSNTPDGQGIISSFLKAISSLQDIGTQLTQKEIALKFEQELSFPSLIEIERIEKSIDDKTTERSNLEDKFKEVLNRTEGIYDETDEAIVENLINETQKEIETFKLERQEYQTRYENRKIKQQENIVILRDALEDLQEEKEKQWQLIRTKGTQVLNYMIIIIGLVVFFSTLQWLSEKLIRKVSANFNEYRQNTLIKINRIVFKTILILIILGLFFSQITTFLPFLAIIGTGLAFAVRDIISSFLAWFVIGGERGYRTGQIVGISDVVGKVIEVKPLITVLEDRTHGYPTGKLISFPNKVIFEGKISHYSHNLGLVPVETEFLLSENTDLDLAESKLLEIAQEINKEIITMIAEKSSKITKQTIYEIEDLETIAWSEVNTDGISLKIRSMTEYGQHDNIVTDIRKTFTRWVKDEKKVSFHFTTVGRHN